MKKKSGKKEIKKHEPGKKAPSVAVPAVDEKQFDFGGLPERNLKKNLGC